MKVTLESTTKMVEFNGVPARIWEGETKSGIRVCAFITRIAHGPDETRTDEFKKELEVCRAPSAEFQAIPLRMIL
jgi:hypothetical protein